MAAQFPAAVPVYSNPTASMTLGSADHVALHSNIQDDVEQIAQKLGFGSTNAVPAARLVYTGIAAGTSGWLTIAHGATITIAASDSATTSKNAATYVCDGTADEVEINAALAALPSIGGTVLLAEGTYTIAAPIATAKAGSHIVGAGVGATTIKVVNTAGAPVNTTLVQLIHARSRLDGVTVDGNKANNAGQTSMVLVGANAADCRIINVAGQNSAGISFSVLTSGHGTKLVGCLSDSPASSAFRFGHTGTNPVEAVHCSSRSAGAIGFYAVSGSTVLSACDAVSSTSQGFYADTTVVDMVLSGCFSRANSVGYYFTAGNIVVNGCDAVSNNGQGLLTLSTAAVAVTGGLYTNNTSYGMYLNGGTAISITGAKIALNGSYGIVIDVASGCHVVGNFFYNNSTTTNNAATQLFIATSDNVVHGNTFRRGPSGNRASHGILISSGSNNYIGPNDTYDSGNTAEISDSGTATRRQVKLQLDYSHAADLNGGASLATTAGTPTDLVANQTFRVDSATSVVEISVRLGALGGAGGTVPSTWTTQIVVDSAGANTTHKLSSDTQQVATTQYTGLNGGTVRITGLAIGNHTVKIQAVATQNGAVFLRASSTPTYEYAKIQVTEYQR